MSDWETYTGGGDGNSAANLDNDGWDPDGGNDSDDWNPDAGKESHSDEEEGDDWDPDGGNESRAENDRPDNYHNDDSGGGFWENYFGDNESEAGIKSEEDADDESKSENARNEQNDDVASHEKNFFAKVEHDNTGGWGESSNDDGVEEFYKEASKRKQPLASPSSPGSRHSSEVSLSQQSHAFSQHSNISAAELSRMEEELLSETTHREEEMKRQTEKQKRREKRRSGESRKRPRNQLSEEQNEYKAAYFRIKYEKAIELSEELDTGGCLAYLSRKQLEEESEQTRLKGLAWERERVRRTEVKKGGDGDEVASSKQDSRTSKSKWSADGYAALPTSQAKDLPFFVYTKRPRSCSNSQFESDSDNSLGSDEESTSDKSDADETEKKKTQHRLLIEENGVALERMDIVCKYKPSRSRNRSQKSKSMIVDYFPLRHNRSKPKMGISLGSEEMVWSHGRNAKRLWARMIAANGVGIRECHSSKYVDEKSNDTEVNSESSSSRSSNLSDQPPGPGSSGMTVLASAATRTDDTDNIVTDNYQLLRLTRQIHELPKTTHRQHLVTSVAHELGRNRYLWEGTLQEWVENHNFVTQEKQRAIKYFFGVDGDITSGAFGSIFHTHPTKFVGASRRLRQQLLRRFRSWVRKKQEDPNHKLEDTGIDEMELFDPMANSSGTGGAGFDADDANIIFNSSNMDICNISATLSYFLDELSLVKKRYNHLQQLNSSSGNCIRLAHQDVSRWHQIISSYLSMVNKESKPTLAVFVKSNTTQYQLPLFRAVAAQHSYIANGSSELLFRKEEENDESDSDIEREQKPSHKKVSQNDLKKNELFQINHDGKEIFQSTRGYVNNEGLVVFTPIHLTIGISTITEFLPPRATEILSRQTYAVTKAVETPFDLIRLMLVYLEERGSLISTGSNLNNTRERPVVDEMLAEAMRTAIGIFRRCKQLEPRNVQYWSWYVAAVFGRLCIASGTSLSVDTNTIESKRQQLPCFSEARAEASCAVDEFVQCAKIEDCPMFFYGVTSMLEWKRAIILLHRHALFSTVHRLHAYTTYQWAIKSRSMASLQRVQSLYADKKIPLDALLDVLAGFVEQNACDIRSWSMLVTALGGVGTTAEAKCNTTRQCSDGCIALHKGFCLNHTRQQERKEGVWWWGKSRAHDWESKFFAAPRSNVATSHDFIRSLLGAKSSAYWKSLDRSQVITARAASQEASLPDDPQDCMDWLFDEEEGDNDTDIDLGYEHLLPGKSTSTTILSSDDQLGNQSKITNSQMRALCLKIIVACHLFSPNHPFVSNSIWWLSLKSHASNISACESLHWLALHGLDIQSYIKKRLRTEV
ncbi:hypothetical protein ACHAXM_007270 [Skeletonema potamos]